MTRSAIPMAMLPPRGEDARALAKLDMTANRCATSAVLGTFVKRRGILASHAVWRDTVMEILGL